MWVEFKEKPFETYFLAELSRRTNILYSPDQTDEGVLGFDGAFFLALPEWREFFPFVRFRRWRRFIGMSASAIDEFGQALNDRLPPFNLNLFVQYKRPEWLGRRNATEWASWTAPYFRYTIEEKQQRLLEKIDRAASGRAAVIYAAAAFRTSDELFAHARSGMVTTHSNLASAARLTGHQRFTYAAPGHFGVAHSEPEDVESPSLDDLLRGAADSESLPFTRQMKAAAELIENALEDDSDARVLWRSAREALLGGEFGDLSPRSRGSWLDAIVSLIAFSHAFDIRIHAIG
jgi:hypothetical protein